MPSYGNGTRFVQSSEPLARFSIGGQRLRVAMLFQADTPKVEFTRGDAPAINE